MTPNEERLQARSERAEACVTAYEALAVEAECGTFRSRWFQVGHYIVGVRDDEFAPTITVKELTPFERRLVGGDALLPFVNRVGDEGGFEHATPVGAMLCSARLDGAGKFLVAISPHRVAIC